MYDTYSKEQVGRRLRAYRTANNYTQNQFSEILDISVNFLSEIENGHKGVSMDMLAKLCKTLELPADYILFGYTSSPAEGSVESIADELNALTTEQLLSISAYITSLLEVRKISRPRKKTLKKIPE